MAPDTNQGTHPLEPLLKVEDLTVTFGRGETALTALNGIDLQVAPGELLGVVGESGAGKSLLSAALMGLLPREGRIASGKVTLAGDRIDTLGDAEMQKIRGRRIGMIFQDPMTSLNPLLTIGDQITETLVSTLNLTSSQARKRMLELLDEIGITEPQIREKSYPHEFSGGMRQRVVIALALAGEPELVLADEPTTALDVSLQKQIIGLIANLCKTRSAGVILITHDMGVVAQNADRVAVMYAGRVVEVGPTAQLMTNPMHPYTRGLIQSIPPLDYRPNRLTQIPGAMPRLRHIPSGCAFHPRCPQAVDACRQVTPAMERRGDRQARCLLYADDPIKAGGVA
ncbi:MAG: methionine ABC transporter ATP-binding protein [Rhodobacteraceae bacterium]|nr:methionine ABC transporter ATP-binding protein [Paracoccaceae bacterium]